MPYVFNIINRDNTATSDYKTDNATSANTRDPKSKTDIRSQN